MGKDREQPIDKFAFLQADFVNMAYSINPKNSEDYLKRRMFLLLFRCFNRKNGKNYTFSEATEMLDKKLENLDVQYQRQYDLLKGVIEADKKKYSNLSKDNLSDKEIIELFVDESSIYSMVALG